MAVIRQRTQVFNQPVGVTRAASGEQIGQVISQVASRIADMSFREAAINAEDVGQKAGMARSSTDIVTLDPETGNPVAYSAPKSYGRIAARSYQNMIDRRFEESVIDEMKKRGAEIAKTSSSADQYRDRMSSYVEEMYKNGVSQGGELNAYGRYIQEAGTEYVASTYSTLRNKEISDARSAVIRQNQLGGYQRVKEIEVLIQSGGPDDQINKMIAAEVARNLDMFNTQAIKFSTFKSNMDKLEGYQGLLANNNLAKYYGSLSEADRAAVTLAIQDPSKADALGERLNRADLGEMITKARISTNVPTLLAGLKTMGESVDTIVDSAADQFVQENGYRITPDMSANDLDALVNTVGDENVRAEVRQDFSAQFVMIQLDEAAGSAGVMDVISNELEKATPNLAVIEASIGGPRGAEVRSLLKTMTYEQRKDLSKELTDRRAQLARLGEAGEKSQEQALRQSMRDLFGSKDVLNKGLQVKAGIESSGLDNTDELLNRWGEAFVGSALAEVSEYEMTSLSQLEAMRNAIKSPDATFSPSNEDEAKAFSLLKEAYKVSRSTVDSALGDRITGWDQSIKSDIEGNFISSAEAIMDNGGSLLPADMEKYDKTVFAGKVLNAARMMEEPAVVRAIANNVVLPSMARALSSALTSNNEDETLSALALFERMSNLEGRTERGVSMGIDVMRGALDSKTYSLYSAALFLQNKELVEPLVAIRRFKDYDGDIDADLKARLGVAKNAPLSDVLSDTFMTNDYRREILNTLRVMHANGYPLDEDSVESVINDYTSRMASDEAVIGPGIGDKTVYARQPYVGQMEIITNRSALADAIADDPNYQKILKGGTVADSDLQFISNLFPSSPRIARSFMAAIGSVSAAEEISDRDRALQGLEYIGADLKYKPIVSSFNAGVPAWEVGYETSFGGFQQIFVNNEPWVLSKPIAESQSRSDALFQANNQLSVALRSDAPAKDIERARLRVFAFTKGIDSPDRLENAPEISKIKRALGDDWSQVFNDFRAEYESLPE